MEHSLITPNSAAADIFHAGLALHKAGRLTQAAMQYERALKLDPEHFAALHSLGVLSAQIKNYGRAVELIKCALKIDPGSAPAFNNLGNVYRELGQLHDAVSCFDNAVRIQSGYAVAHYNLGNTLRNLNQHYAALASFRRARACSTDYFDVFCSEGLTYMELRQFQSAIKCFDKALEINQQVPEIKARRDESLRQLALQTADNQKALLSIVHNGDLAAYYFQNGIALIESNQYDTAIICFDNAIAIRADYAEAYCARGQALKLLKLPYSAVDSFDMATSVKPDCAPAYLGSGDVLFSLEMYWEAIQSFEKAISLQHCGANVYVKMGNALANTRQYQRAIGSYRTAISIKPDAPSAYFNLGQVFRELNEFESAISNYEEAITLDAAFGEAHFNQGLCFLQTGNFERGWEKYEWRFKRGDSGIQSRTFSQPNWSGTEPLAGKTILLYCEQGLGDTIQFCRFVNVVTDFGCRVLLQVQDPLVALLRQLGDAVTVIGQNDDVPAFDFHCSLLSLPHSLGVRLENIPNADSYLHADSVKVAQWREKLSPKGFGRIGLAWSGNPAHANDRARSLQLQKLVEALPSGFQYISLQKEYRQEDMETMKTDSKVRDYSGLLSDFEDTAALCSLMDVVISVDTSVAHLAAALGKPVWLLLPFSADWRWMVNQEDSPWYLSVRLFRQPSIGDWESVLAVVKSELLRNFGFGVDSLVHLI